MPTPDYFRQYPPFPSPKQRNDIPALALPRLQLKKLLSSVSVSVSGSGSGYENEEKEEEQCESKALFDACARLGFFMLDLRGCDEVEALLEEVEMGFGVCGGGFCAEWGGEEKGGGFLCGGRICGEWVSG